MATKLTQTGQEVQEILDRSAILAEKTYVDEGLSKKQDTLVSGENIKTVNGVPILGPGDIYVDVADIFVATFGETPYSEIISRHRAGKRVVVNKGGEYFYENNYATNIVYFVGGYKSEKEWVVSVTASSQWIITESPYMPKSGGEFSGNVTFDSGFRVEGGQADMHYNKVRNLGDPTDEYDAVNKGFVEDHFVSKDNGEFTGNVTFDAGADFLGDVDMHNNRIFNLASPVQDFDAATKEYVDKQLKWHE